MEKIIELFKSLFSKGNIVEKVKTVKQIKKEVKKIAPITKTPIKKKEK